MHTHCTLAIIKSKYENVNLLPFLCLIEFFDVMVIGLGHTPGQVLRIRLGHAHRTPLGCAP